MGGIIMAEMENEVLEQQEVNEVKSEVSPEAEEYYAQLQRVMADFDNYKKRIQKEKESLYSIISAELIGDLLPVLDNLEKSASVEDEGNAVLEGVILVYRQFQDVLKKLGVNEIKTVGEKFNPEYHDAVMHVEDEQYGENEIVMELRKGYILKDRVIRHSMVKVAN